MWSDPLDEILLIKLLKKIMFVLIERCQNRQCIAVCCVWGCTAADQSRCPCWPLSTDESTNNGHVNIRTGPWSNGRRWPGLMNHIFFYVKWMHLRRLPGQHMAPGCTMGGMQAGGGSVMLWAVFCWGNLGSRHPCGCNSDTCHLPKHCCRPCTPFLWKQ